MAFLDKKQWFKDEHGAQKLKEEMAPGKSHIVSGIEFGQFFSQ